MGRSLRPGARLLRLLPVVTLVACASLPPEQRAGLESVERFVAETARLYGLGPIPVVVGEVVGASAQWHDGTIFLAPAVLTASSRDALIAHELGHAVLGHRDFRTTSFASPSTLGEASRLQVPRELDANAKAVEILTRAKGWPETTSLRYVYEWLLGVHRAQERGRPTPLGHVSACEEIRDLRRRFAQHAAMTSGWACPP